MKTNLILREPDLFFDSIHNELNNFLRDTVIHPAFSHELSMKKTSTWRPAVEIKQTESDYLVKVQLPGVNKDAIDVELDNDFMTITAEIEEEKKSIDALAETYASSNELLKKIVEKQDVNEEYIYDILDRWAESRRVKTKKK